MAYEILKSIVDAEAQAVEKKRQAAAQAEELKVKAQAEAAALLEKTRKDGLLMVEAATDEHFVAFLDLLGLNDLTKDSRFATGALRHDNAEALEKAIYPLTQAYTMAELADRCRASGIPVGEVNTMDRFMRSRYVEERNLTTVVHDEKFGDCKTLDFPLQFDKFEIPKHRHASQSGQDTAQVLKELLGLSEEEIKELYSYEGAVKV